MSCSHISTCKLFPLISVNSALNVWKTFYCEGKYKQCARYQASAAGKSVPVNLLPNGKDLEIGKLAGESGAGKNPAPARPAPAPVPTVTAPQIPPRAPSMGAAPAAVATAAQAQPQAQAAAAPSANNLFGHAAPSGDTKSYYLRMEVSQPQGVMSEVIKVMGNHRVRIDAMTEKRNHGDSGKNYLVVLTDQTDAATIATVVKEIGMLPMIAGGIKMLPLDHF